MPTAAIHNLMATAGPKAATHAFVCNSGDNSLSAYSIANPSSMTFVSELTDATNLLNPQSIAIDRTTKIAWVTCFAGRLTGINISNPASMSVIGSYANANISSPAGIVLDPVRKIAFLQQGSVTGSGIIAINISNPASPTLISKLTTSGTERYGIYLDIGRSILYSSGQIRSIDVSNPSSMAILQTFGGGGIALAGKGTNIFYATGGSIIVLDATNPAAMTVSNTFTSMFTGLVPQALVINDDVMMLAIQDANTLRSFNIANPASITVIDTETNATNLANVRSVAIDPFNSNAFATSETNDRLTSYSATGGTITQLQSVASGTNLNGAIAVALL